MSQLKRQLDETAQRIEREIERVRTECLDEQNRRLKEQSDAHAADMGKARKETAEFKDLYTKETQLRRAVHDELMDMKGNIRVFARVRPVLPDEKKMAEEKSGAAGSEVVTDFPSESGGRDIVVRREGSREGSDAKFEFDKVFDPQSTQEEVFNTVAPLIVSVMDGVSVTLFAYGQTGSGKTFTMEGTKENPGVNVRALQRVFEIARDRSTTYSYTFTVSVLEVYLETILDLLGDVEARDAREKLDIRQNPDTKLVFVQGLVKKPVSNMAEVQEILQLASKNRTVGAHNMNEHSSRSHLVFTLTTVGTSLVKKEKFEGNLNLIDLAGSERIGKTDAQGDRLKEAQSINKSLSALGDVINALSLKNSHIPFRNSKLTYLLQDQLQGNAKVGFFANVSPTAFNSSETMCTLNFANRCRKTELGRAKKNVVGGTNEQLMQENARLKRQLEELQGGVPSGNGRDSAPPTPSSTPVRTPVKTLSTSAGSKRGLEKD
jgi:kinesin family protein C2/C3